MAGRDQATTVLDAGAVIGLARGDRGLIKRLAASRSDGDEIIVPMVVLAETTRGSGPRDAAVNLVLAQTAPHQPLDEQTARLAGRLLAAAGASNTVDALIAAEAITSAPSILLTSDAGDMRRLLDGHSGVIVVGI